MATSKSHCFVNCLSLDDFHCSAVKCDLLSSSYQSYHFRDEVKVSTAGGSIIVDNDDNQIYCGLRSVNADRYTRDYFINTSDTRMSRANQEISFSPQDNVEFRQVEF